MPIDKINFTGSGVTATQVGTQLNVAIPGGAGGSLSSTPWDLAYCGDGSGGAFVSSGPVTMDGEHHYTSFNLQLAHTITVGQMGWLVIRVCGPAIVAGTIDANEKGGRRERLTFPNGAFPGAAPFNSLDTSVVRLAGTPSQPVPSTYGAGLYPAYPALSAYSTGIGTGGGSGGGSPYGVGGYELSGAWTYFPDGAASVFMDRVVAEGGRRGNPTFAPDYPTPGSTPALQYRRAMMAIGHRAMGAAGAGVTDGLDTTLAQYLVINAQMALGRGGGYILIVADALTFTGNMTAVGGSVNTSGLPPSISAGGGGVIITSAKTYPAYTGIINVAGGVIVDGAGYGVGTPNGYGGAGWTHQQVII